MGVDTSWPVWERHLQVEHAREIGFREWPSGWACWRPGVNKLLVHKDTQMIMQDGCKAGKKQNGVQRGNSTQLQEGQRGWRWKVRRVGPRMGYNPPHLRVVREAGCIHRIVEREGPLQLERTRQCTYNVCWTSQSCCTESDAAHLVLSYTFEGARAVLLQHLHKPNAVVMFKNTPIFICQFRYSRWLVSLLPRYQLSRLQVR